jgi:hypothetical protein
MPRFTQGGGSIVIANMTINAKTQPTQFKAYAIYDQGSTKAEIYRSPLYQSINFL